MLGTYFRGKGCGLLVVSVVPLLSRSQSLPFFGDENTDELANQILGQKKKEEKNGDDDVASAFGKDEEYDVQMLPEKQLK
jgi:hypothetical protein